MKVGLAGNEKKEVESKSSLSLRSSFSLVLVVETNKNKKRLKDNTNKCQPSLHATSRKNTSFL
jgi:hypothetical protein